MRRRRPRTKPTPTELARIETVLKAQPAFEPHLGPRVPVTKRTGEVVAFHVGTIAVAEALMPGRVGLERTPVRIMLRTAAEVFGIPGHRTQVGGGAQS